MAIALKDKRVLVLGLGETGFSALRWLSKQGARLSVADSRDVPPNLDALKAEMPDVVIKTGVFNADTFANQDVIVVSPGVDVREANIQRAIQTGIPVLGDVELFAQYRDPAAKLIAITGANGKTTVTTLVGEMCKAAGLETVVAGNIGLPVLDALTMPAPDVYVLELSSFQLETANSLVADAATMLNLSEDHLDRHGDMTAYAAAKAHIFYHAKHQVLNRDDAWSMIMARPRMPYSTFGSSDEDYGLVQEGTDIWLAANGQKLMNVDDLKIRGTHNAMNALASLALCRAIGLEFAPLLATLYSFKGLPHRVEWVARIDDVDYYDDSKGTNVGATCAAIAGLPQKVVLLAGGDGKGQDFAPLSVPVKDNARAVVLYGRDADLIEAAMLKTEVPLYRASDMHEAVAIARRVAQAGDAVLLSPACASFDMFKNYEHRAQVFVQAVKAQEAI